MSYLFELPVELTWFPSGDQKGLARASTFSVVVGMLLLWATPENPTPPTGTPTGSPEVDPDDWWTRWRWWLAAAAVVAVAVSLAVAPPPAGEPPTEVVRFVPGETFFGWVTPDMATPLFESFFIPPPGEDLLVWGDKFSTHVHARVGSLTPAEVTQFLHPENRLPPGGVDLVLRILRERNTLGDLAGLFRGSTQGFHPYEWTSLVEALTEEVLEVNINDIAEVIKEVTTKKV